MDTISTLHARVAALARFRPADDPELVDCRRRLQRLTADAETLRARISTLPAEDWTLDAQTDPTPQNHAPDAQEQEVVRRLSLLANRWAQVPAKRQASAAILGVLASVRSEAARV